MVLKHQVIHEHTVSYSADFCEKKRLPERMKCLKNKKKTRNIFFPILVSKKKQKKTHGKNNVFLEKLSRRNSSGEPVLKDAVNSNAQLAAGHS